MSVEEKVVHLIQSVGNDLPVNYNNIDLFATDVLDSLGVMQMIMELDDLFGIDIDVDDVVETNFDTVAHIVTMVEKYINL